MTAMTGTGNNNQVQVTLTLRSSPNIIKNILQLVSDFVVMRTSQQEVTNISRSSSQSHTGDSLKPFLKLSSFSSVSLTLSNILQ